ncbi:hypothetical protein [Actinoplanes friuliensis]|uniref:DUF4188 domain-containing protein n=1 Tax=Actinoplanes friuliensis DSM 7358 TaxID=1246995 RepID=U5W087_9ACTN|nr:hypothetical protein [Actinoplanes friuliensis]AGZ41395.1 hypothetical protein AFR_15565 [Actinoplanes friuliensis DSM 7358]
MRTTDFSAVPLAGQANAMFVGATRYAGLGSILLLSRRFFRMVKQMKRMSGYRWHTVYYRFPFTLGTIAFFDDRDALLKFARSKTHRDLMCWITDNGTRHAKAGFIRLYDADPHGYSNGVWRAEDTTMSHIETFTPLSTETAGPPVHRS